MKILFVQKVKGYAGSENWMTSIIPGLVKKGVHCHLLCVIPPEDEKKLDEFKSALAKYNIAHTFIFSKKDFSYSLFNQLKVVAKNDNYDLIHLNLIHAELWFSILQTFFGLKTRLVSAIHGFEEKFQGTHGFNHEKLTNSAYVRILKFSQKRIHRYYAISEGLKTLMIKGNIIPDHKISVINYGFDYPEIKVPNPKNERLVKTIFVPGRIIPVKRQEIIIDCIDLLIEKGLHFKIVFAGELQGDYGNYLKQKLKHLNHLNKVEFLGHVPNIGDYFLAADLVLLLSKAEGFGIVLLEAFNYEAPVITFDVPAFNEIIKHQKTGILSPNGELPTLVENIIEVLTHKELSTMLTKNAKKDLKTYYNLDRMVDETIRFYERSLAD